MFSFAITAFEEMSERRGYGKRLLASMRAAQEHPLIQEVVVVDDGSDDWPDLIKHLQGQPKLALYHNDVNRGVFVNKIEAIALARNSWVITCDSDNVMDTSYLKHMTEVAGWGNTWYCASFARPRFDYRELCGVYDLQGLTKIFDKKIFPCFFNTGNQTIHHQSFMEVFGKYRQKRADLMMPNYLDLTLTKRQTHYWRMVFDACDSFLLNMKWILAGNEIHIVKGLEYEHHYAEGDAGNYARSPSEKGALGDILLKKLRTAVEECQ